MRSSSNWKASRALFWIETRPLGLALIPWGRNGLDVFWKQLVTGRCWWAIVKSRPPYNRERH